MYRCTYWQRQCPVSCNCTSCTGGPDASKPENNLKVELNLKELFSHFMDIFIFELLVRIILEKKIPWPRPVYHLHEQVGAKNPCNSLGNGRP